MRRTLLLAAAGPLATGGLIAWQSAVTAPVAQAEVASRSCHGPKGFGAVYMRADWPGGFHGVPVFSNGVPGSFTNCLHWTRTPSGMAVVDGYEWQCVELVNRLWIKKGWIHSYWRGNGDQLFATAPRDARKQRQGRIRRVHPGDVISFAWKAGGPGHAAVVARVQGSYLTIANQNTDRANVQSHAWLRSGRIVMVGWPGWRVIGLVHRPSTMP
jgi:hypothetical protein